MLHAANKLGIDTVLECRNILVTLSYDRLSLAVIRISFLRHSPKSSHFWEGACK